MDAKEKYSVVGLMSGTSLDGLDIAHCVFKKTEQGWNYAITQAQTVKYPSAWLHKLSNAHTLPGSELIELDVHYGKYLGKTTRDFVASRKLKVDFIASHGHT